MAAVWRRLRARVQRRQAVSGGSWRRQLIACSACVQTKRRRLSLIAVLVSPCHIAGGIVRPSCASPAPAAESLDAAALSRGARVASYRVIRAGGSLGCVRVGERVSMTLLPLECRLC